MFKYSFPYVFVTLLKFYMEHKVEFLTLVVSQRHVSQLQKDVSFNTERFMPIRSELLAMSPSVCRSAPLCFSTSMRLYFTEFILNGTERQYRKNYAHKK